MSVEQMWNRLACLDDESLTLRELNEGNLANSRAQYLMSLSEKLVGFSPLFFESTEFRALIAAAQAEIKASSDSILFIDYIGLFSDRRLGPQERYWLISECARGLKLLARQLDIPVIAAAQLNRYTILESAGRRQEFVMDSRHYPEVVSWARNLILSGNQN